MRQETKKKKKLYKKKKNPIKDNWKKKRNAPIAGFHQLSQSLQDGLFSRQLLFTATDLQLLSEHLKLTSRHLPGQPPSSLDGWFRPCVPGGWHRGQESCRRYHNSNHSLYSEVPWPCISLDPLSQQSLLVIFEWREAHFLPETVPCPQCWEFDLPTAASNNTSNISHKEEDWLQRHTSPWPNPFQDLSHPARIPKHQQQQPRESVVSTQTKPTFSLSQQIHVIHGWASRFSSQQNTLQNKLALRESTVIVYQLPRKRSIDRPTRERTRSGWFREMHE